LALCLEDGDGFLTIKGGNYNSEHSEVNKNLEGAIQWIIWHCRWF